MKNPSPQVLARKYNELAIAAPDSMWTKKFAHPRMEVTGEVLELKVSVWDDEHRQFVVVPRVLTLADAQQYTVELKRDIKNANVEAEA